MAASNAEVFKTILLNTEFCEETFCRLFTLRSGKMCTNYMKDSNECASCRKLSWIWLFSDFDLDSLN